MTTTATTTQGPKVCDCVNEECAEIHAGDDLLPEAYLFWVINQKVDTLYGSSDLDTMVMELRDLSDGAPFLPGEAVVMDLGTGVKLDALAFLAAHGA